MTERIKTAFDTIRADEELKRRTRDYLAQTIYGKKRKAECSRRRFRVHWIRQCLRLLMCSMFLQETC